MIEPMSLKLDQPMLLVWEKSSKIQRICPSRNSELKAPIQQCVSSLGAENPDHQRKSITKETVNLTYHATRGQ
jgi:hypothetical protein